MWLERSSTRGLSLSPHYSFLSEDQRSCEESAGSMVMRPWDTAPRVDAQASEDRTGIGSWAPELDEEGCPYPWRSRWYSHEITKT